MGKYADHFYRGRWPDVPYTARTRRSPLGHWYVRFTTDHPAPVGPPGEFSSENQSGAGCSHSMGKQQMRYVEVKGVRYLRVEDVVAYVRELGGGEETDVRNRLNQAAANLMSAPRPRKSRASRL